MRRVSSYGGPSGVAGSERLKQRLSLTPGLHLISTSSTEESGFLAVLGDPKDERVIHRTFGATRNFYAIAPNLKQVPKRKSWVARKDPFIFDEPVDSNKYCAAPTPLVEETNGKHSIRPVVNDEVPREGGVEAVPKIPSNDRQVVEEVSAGGDTPPLELSDDPAGLLLANELQGAGPDWKTIPLSIALAEADNSLSTSATAARQDAETSRAGQFEADASHNVDVLSNENSQLPECGGGLQESQNGRSKDVAAVAIQRFWRGWKHRKDFKEVKERVVFLQSLVRRNQEFKQYHRTLKAAVVVQKHWRGQRGRWLVKQQNLERVAMVQQQRIEGAAVMMQKHWRAQRGRCFVKHLKMELAVKEKQRKNHAAIVLQKHWRAQRGRCSVKHLKVEHAVKEKQRRDHSVIVLQKHWRAQQARCLTRHLRMDQVARETKRTNDAAVVLQKHWRAHQSRYLTEHLRKELALKQKEKVLNAAIVLQKNWRAHQGMCLGKQLKKEQVLRELQKIDDASVVLQKHWRAQQGRRLVKHMKMEQILREQQRINGASIVLQKHWRAQQGRCLGKLLKKEQVLREQQRIDDAAVVLQKHWRAQQGRRLVEQLKVEQILREQQRINNATIVLQKCWRAQQGRRLFKHLKMDHVAREQQRKDNAAVVVQKHWRVKQGRSLVKHLKLEQDLRDQQRNCYAATVIQKHWRAQQARCWVKLLKMEQVAMENQKTDNAAVVLQKHWRGLRSRSLVKHLKMELSLKEFQRLGHAAVVLQKQWRARQSRVLVERMRREQLLRHRKMDHAAIVLQRPWRGWQSRYLFKDLKDKRIVDNAAIVVQKHWRAHQSRLTVKHLRMELAAREESQRVIAATMLQKYWRARQSVLLVKHLKMENTRREQHRAENAATVLQRHWRGHHSRLLVKHLQSDQALRKLQRKDNAAITLQKHWRCFQSRNVLKLLYMERADRESAALCIQARVRGNAARVKFKAALTIQKAWQLYLSSRLAVAIYHACQERRLQAITVLQAYARGFVVRRRLRDVAKCISKAEFVESSPISSLVQCVDSGSQSVDQIHNRSADGWQKLECGPVNSQDRCGGHDLDGECSTTSVGDVQSQKKQVQEDWNYVAVDQLEECLDTCLGSLRPLPTGSQHCLPGLDVPEKSQQFTATDRNVENNSNVSGASSRTELSRSACNEPNNLTGSPSDTPRMQSYQVKPQATPIGAREQVGLSSGCLQETATEQVDKPAQGRSVAMQTLKQKEQKLKQFAQVFLLQRTIALQQQRAQAAPPFPPPMNTVRSEVPTHAATQTAQPVAVANGDQKDVAVQSITPWTEAQLMQINGEPEEEHHVVCEIVDPENKQRVTKQAPERQNSGAKQEISGPGADVILDMVLLLRRMKEEYGNSEGDFEGESSTWCTSGCGDIEEGIPLLERNLGLMRESSMSKLANAVSIKRISIPDVNAVLLVFIAMVVYTRTVCKGLFFGARQTYRRP